MRMNLNEGELAIAILGDLNRRDKDGEIAEMIMEVAPGDLEEIAIEVVYEHFAKHGMPGRKFRRQLGSLAQRINVPFDDVLGFYEGMMPRLIGEILFKKNISIQTE
jgi:hypothetical protein